MRSSDRRSSDDVILVAPRHGSERVRPDDGPRHGRVAEQLLLLLGQQVDACRDDPEHGLRKRSDIGRVLYPHELLGVERVACRSLDDCAPEMVVRRIAPQERLHEALDVGVRQRPERHREHVALASAPVRSSVEQLGSRAADDEQRDADDQLRQLVDEVEEAVVGPLQVVEHDHQRALIGNPLQEQAPRGVGLSSAIA